MDKPNTNRNVLRRFEEMIQKLDTRTIVFWGYVFIIVVFVTGRGLRVSFDLLFLLLFGVVLLMPRRLPIGSFLRDWLPFVLLLAAYEFMRGIADNLSARVHIEDLIAWEASWFGDPIPTLRLQEALYVAGVYAWYDYAFAIVYASFYFFPFMVGFFLWFRRREDFKIFSNGFLLLSFAGFLTYVLYPAMPPWLASREGFLPEVTKILEGMSTASLGIQLPSVYQAVGANLIAAMPSLHSAWPWYTALSLVYFFGWKMWPFFFLPLVTWLGVVYLGEHYLVDVVAGVGYATLAFLATIFLRQKIVIRRRHAIPPPS
ncbi:MAG: phosphatase PAP2 family protein [bacterium]|nr:phosphatase PAP2 family protein [bacterium]